MTLLILDPDLTHARGETAIEALAIADEAARRGESVVILAARDFAGPMPEGLRVFPYFTHRSDAVLHDDPITGRFDDFCAHNDAIADDLARIPRSETRAADAVFVPCATANQLVGLAAWMKAFDVLDAPSFFVRLGPGPRAEDRETALHWRLGFRVLDEDGPPIHLGAIGRALAQDHTALAGRSVEAMPLPICPDPALRRTRAARCLAIFAPAGATLAESLMRALAAAQPDWKIVLYGSETQDSDGARGLLPADADLALVLPGAGPEPRTPLWEALARGVPVLLPRHSWMAREAAYWGEYLGFYPDTANADQVARHVAGAAKRFEELRDRAALTAKGFRAANGAAALLDRIGRPWAARMAAAFLLVRDGETQLDLAALRLDGWHRMEEGEDGHRFRWTAQTPEIEFDWPFLVPWQLRLHLRAHHGDEQLRGIRAHCAGEALTVAVANDAGGAVLRVEGRPGDPADPLVRLRLDLPMTRRPPDDPRDLGVMVSAIALRAASVVPAMPSGGNDLAVSVRGAADEAGGWTLHGTLSGDVASGLDRPAALSLRLDVPGGPVVARGLALYLNGVPLRLEVNAETGTIWTGLAALPPALLRQAGPISHWDLVGPETEGGPARLLAIRVVRMARMAAAATPPAARAGASDAPEAPKSHRSRKWFGGG